MTRECWCNLPVSLYYTVADCICRPMDTNRTSKFDSNKELSWLYIYCLTSPDTTHKKIYIFLLFNTEQYSEVQFQPRTGLAKSKKFYPVQLSAHLSLPNLCFHFPKNKTTGCPVTAIQRRTTVSPYAYSWLLIATTSSLFSHFLTDSVGVLTYIYTSNA